MSDDFISCDNVLSKIYRHDGFSFTITDWFSTYPDYQNPLCIAWDGSNVLSSDWATEKTYKHDGFSSVILDSFSHPGNKVTGLCWDGNNLLSTDDDLEKTYKHDGFSSTILDSFATPATNPWGVAWDGSNVLSSDWLTEKIYKHSGFSPSITDSFSTPGPYTGGLDWHGGNLYSGDSGTLKFYKHDGFSSTITDSFDAPASAPIGLAWGTGMSPPSQLGRPDGDITVGSFSPYPSSPTTLWDKIDEQFPNFETDYILSDTKDDYCEFSLTDMIDPGTGLNHFIQCWARCPAGSGKAEKIYIALVENGTVRGQSPATTVVRYAWTEIIYALTEAEANSITNYANLRLRVYIVDAGAGEAIQITQLEFKCSGAGMAEAYTSPLTMIG